MIFIITLIVNILSVYSFNCDDSIFSLPGDVEDYSLCLDGLGDFYVSGDVEIKGKCRFNVSINTYSPTLSDGTNSYTLTNSICYYTLQNNYIDMFCDISWNGKISIIGGNNFLVSLPIKSNSIYGYGFGSISYLQGITYSSFITTYLGPNSNNMSFYSLGGLGTINNVLNSVVSTNGRIVFKISYYT